MGYPTEFDQDNDDGGPTEVPFCPGNSRGIDLNAVPRYLFRVFTKETAGWNSSKWMKSAASLQTTVKDIFTREDTGDVAYALNAYLSDDSMPIQECAFITWTASLAIALHFAIFKAKRESLQLADVHLCVIDTAMFPLGTFISAIVLMEAFQSAIPEHDTIQYDGFPISWRDCGLTATHQTCTSSNDIDLAMYLAQGRLRIMDRSAVLSCDKIINNDLLVMAPIFNCAFQDRKFSLEHTIIAFRRPFTQKASELITSGEGLAALRIAKKFPSRWRNMMMAGLLALYPRPKDDPGCVPFDIASLQEESRYQPLDRWSLSPGQFDRVPELLQFYALMDGIQLRYVQDLCSSLTKSLSNSIQIIDGLLASPDFGIMGPRHRNTGQLSEVQSFIDEIDARYFAPLEDRIIDLREELRLRGLLSELPNSNCTTDDDDTQEVWMDERRRQTLAVRTKPPTQQMVCNLGNGEEVPEKI